VIAFPSFGIDPTQRIAVTVTDASGTPLPNVEVTLNDDAQAIWRAVTDKNGKAYVFDANHTGVSLTATQGEISQTVSDLFENAKDEQGNIQTGDLSYEFVLDTEQKLYHDTQIMFIVDTTGSMADEMLYLQSDFSAIAEEAGDENRLGPSGSDLQLYGWERERGLPGGAVSLPERRGEDLPAADEADGPDAA
jgi:hypothetical protein